MKFQRGDRIILLHSGEEGEIVDFINNKMVLVEAGGVSFPVYTDQIDFPYFNRFTKPAPKIEKPQVPKLEELRREPPGAKYGVTEGMWLVFLPIYDSSVFDEDIVDHFRLYLVNQTSDQYRFSYQVHYGGRLGFSLENQITGLVDFYLHDLPFEDMNDSPRFDFIFRPEPQDPAKEKEWTTSVRMRGKQLFAKLEQLRLEQKAHFSIELFSSFPKRTKPEKQSGTDYPSLGRGVEARGLGDDKPLYGPPRTVVDLHIEKLTDQFSGMKPAEMLDLQMKSFEKFYDLAVLHRQDMLTVVHGLGTGRLRDEIHQWLRSRKEVKSFVNQYHPLYGFGATEIFFQFDR